MKVAWTIYFIYAILWGIGGCMEFYTVNGAEAQIASGIGTICSLGVPFIILKAFTYIKT